MPQPRLMRMPLLVTAAAGALEEVVTSDVMEFSCRCGRRLGSIVRGDVAVETTNTRHASSNCPHRVCPSGQAATVCVESAAAEGHPVAASTRHPVQRGNESEGCSG